MDHILEVQTRMWGQRYADYRDLLRRAVAMTHVPDYPIHVDFDSEGFRNLACINCSENYRPWSRALLDLDRPLPGPAV